MIEIDLILRWLIRCPQSFSRQSIIIVTKRTVIATNHRNIWTVNSEAGMQHIQLKTACLFVYLFYEKYSVG